MEVLVSYSFLAGTFAHAAANCSRCEKGVDYPNFFMPDVQISEFHQKAIYMGHGTESPDLNGANVSVQYWNHNQQHRL